MAAVTVYSAPEDGRKGRPKHVENNFDFCLTVHHQLGHSATLPLTVYLPTTTTGYHML